MLSNEMTRSRLAIHGSFLAINHQSWQNDHPRELQSRGHKVKSDPGEEGPESTEQGGVIQLQQYDSDPKSREQIAHEVGACALQPI
jgi:hypothetical protein